MHTAPGPRPPGPTGTNSSFPLSMVFPCIGRLRDLASRSVTSHETVDFHVSVTYGQMPRQEVLVNVQEASSGSSGAFEKAVEGFRVGSWALGFQHAVPAGTFSVMSLTFTNACHDEVTYGLFSNHSCQ